MIPDIAKIVISYCGLADIPNFFLAHHLDSHMRFKYDASMESDIGSYQYFWLNKIERTEDAQKINYLLGQFANIEIVGVSFDMFCDLKPSRKLSHLLYITAYLWNHEELVNINNILYESYLYSAPYSGNAIFEVRSDKSFVDTICCSDSKLEHLESDMHSGRDLDAIGKCVRLKNVSLKNHNRVMCDLSCLKNATNLRCVRIFDKWGSVLSTEGLNCANLRYIFLNCCGLQNVDVLMKNKKICSVHLIQYSAQLDVCALYKCSRLNYFIHTFAFVDQNCSITVHPLNPLIYVHVFGCTDEHISILRKDWRVDYNNFVAYRYRPCCVYKNEQWGVQGVQELQCAYCHHPIDKKSVIFASCSNDLSLLVEFVNDHGLTMIRCPTRTNAE